MKIKICGIQSANQLLDAGVMPDYLGFILAPSRRNVAVEQIALIKQQLDLANTNIIGVFVNAEMELLDAAAPFIDLFQLHGDEDEEFIAEVKARFNKPVIKVVRVCSCAQIAAADSSVCDFLLLDTYSPCSYGGVGKVFDYSLIPPMKHQFFIAGGINIENVDAAVSSGAFCVDINSGVESCGIKDAAKIKAIVDKIKSLT